MAHLLARILSLPALLAGLALIGAGCAADGGGEVDPGPIVPLEAEEGSDDHPGEPDPSCDDGCVSELTEFGLLCTTCPGSAEPECLVASCGVIDRCLQCTDPKGRTGTDCSIDYESLPTASHTVGGGDTFHVCTAAHGYPGGTSGVCHYPGPETCDIDEEANCIECRYQDGSGSSLCLGDPDEPLPDVLNGRPSTLPEPGQCITETSEDGLLQCSTCTREDLSATKACRMPPADSCDFASGDDPIEHCLTCSLVEGGSVTFCDEAGS